MTKIIFDRGKIKDIYTNYTKINTCDWSNNNTNIVASYDDHSGIFMYYDEQNYIKCIIDCKKLCEENLHYYYIKDDIHAVKINNLDDIYIEHIFGEIIKYKKINIIAILFTFILLEVLSGKFMLKYKSNFYQLFFCTLCIADKFHSEYSELLYNEDYATMLCIDINSFNNLEIEILKILNYSLYSSYTSLYNILCD